MVIVGIANLFYELSLIFYNSLLKDISTDKNLGKSSGFGFALGYIGGIIILLISIKLFIDTENLPFGLIKEESQNIRAKPKPEDLPKFLSVEISFSKEL